MQRSTITRVHPHTGIPLEPVYVTRHGVPRYPILGAAEDDGEGVNNDGDGDGSGDGSGADGGDEGGKGDGGDGEGGDEANLGFPKDTAIKDMTLEQKAAYWEHHAKKHERAWQSKSLVEMTPDEVRALRDRNAELERGQMSANERAIADAKAEGERIGRESATSEARDRSLGYIEGHIDALLTARGIKRDDVSDLLDTFDRSKFLTDEGDIDTVKVATVIGGALPSGNGRGRGNGQGPDMGQGNRGGGNRTTGVDAGVDLYDRIHNKKKK